MLDNCRKWIHPGHIADGAAVTRGDDFEGFTTGLAHCTESSWVRIMRFVPGAPSN